MLVHVTKVQFVNWQPISGDVIAFICWYNNQLYLWGRHNLSESFSVGWETRVTFFSHPYTNVIDYRLSITSWHLFAQNKHNVNAMKLCSDLTIKNKNDVIDSVLVFLLLTLFIFMSLTSVSIFDFEQVNVFGNW